jgi:kinesin family protein 2/24
VKQSVADKKVSAQINKTLFALKECIRAVHAKQMHAPFRNALLTRLLQPYLTSASGTCTVMVATLSPRIQDKVASWNTLVYADLVAKSAN